MKLCAIVLDYRGASKTEACLRSLCGQGIDTVMLVDNSDDVGASAELTNALDRLQSTVDYALHVLRPQTNLGFARGVNFAIGHAASQHCDAVLLLNNDAAIAPGAAQKLAAALDADGADIAAPSLLDDRDKPQPQLWYQRFLGLQTKGRLPGSYSYLSGCCMLFRRSLAPAGQLFDEDFFMYGEDAFLGWQILRKGKRATIVHAASVRHTGQGTWPSCSLFYEYQTARAHILLAAKTWRTPIERPVLLLTKAAGLLARALRRSIHYRNLIPMAAFFLAWRALDIRKNP